MLFQYQKDATEEELSVCTNYRYARRKEEAANIAATGGDKKDQDMTATRADQTIDSKKKKKGP